MVRKNWVIPSIESILITIVTLLLLRHFADRKRTPWICQAMTFVGWLLGFSMIFLIPLDIYTTIINGNTADPTLIWIWYAYYWGSYVLNWTLFPFTVYYLEAGEFTWTGKTWYSLKTNAPWYLLYAFILGSICIFLYFTEGG